MIETATKEPPGLIPSVKISAGLMCRHHRRSGFKVALVVGATTDGKLRVRFWRAASFRWTYPITVDEADLTNLVEADYKARRAVIARAADAAVKQRIAPRVWS